MSIQCSDCHSPGDLPGAWKKGKLQSAEMCTELSSCEGGCEQQCVLSPSLKLRMNLSFARKCTFSHQAKIKRKSSQSPLLICRNFPSFMCIISGWCEIESEYIPDVVFVIFCEFASGLVCEKERRRSRKKNARVSRKLLSPNQSSFLSLSTPVALYLSFLSLPPCYPPSLYHSPPNPGLLSSEDLTYSKASRKTSHISIKSKEEETTNIKCVALRLNFLKVIDFSPLWLHRSWKEGGKHVSQTEHQMTFTWRS